MTTVTRKFEPVLERVVVKERAKIEKHLALCDAEASVTHGALWRRVAGILGELAPLSRNLKTAGEIGLRALEYLESNTTPPADWVTQQNRALDEIGQPVAEVILAAVRPVRLLVNAAGK